MDLTDEQLEEMFGYGDEELPLDIIIINLTGAHPFIQEGLHFLDDRSVVVYLDPAEYAPAPSLFSYLGELLAQPDYRLDQVFREDIRLSSSQSAYPKPPRVLGCQDHQVLRRPMCRNTEAGWCR